MPLNPHLWLMLTGQGAGWDYGDPVRSPVGAGPVVTTTR
jgi:hypothetical protein